MSRDDWRAQISATTFIFFMILGLVVAGFVIRTFLVPAATAFEQGQLTKSVANLKGAFDDVCAGRSAGREVQLSVPSKDGVFLFYSCVELMGMTTVAVINGKPITDSATIDGLKAKCPTDSSGPEKRAVLAYGWDRSWDWWFYHKTDIEIKSEPMDCGKPVYARAGLGGGDYKRFMMFEKNASVERVVLSG